MYGLRLGAWNFGRFGLGFGGLLGFRFPGLWLKGSGFRLGIVAPANIHTKPPDLMFPQNSKGEGTGSKWFYEEGLSRFI